MTDTTTAPDDLTALREQIARLEQAQTARDREQTAREEMHAVPRPPAPSALAKVTERFSEARRRIRLEAQAEADRAYEEQLEAARPVAEKLKAELRKLNEQDRVEQQRHADAMAATGEKRATVNRKLNELSVPRVSFESLMDRPERLEELRKIRREEFEEWHTRGVPFEAWLDSNVEAVARNYSKRQAEEIRHEYGRFAAAGYRKKHGIA